MRCAIITILLLLTSKLYCQGIVKHIPQVEGSIYSMTSRNDTVFVGGRFSNIFHADSVGAYGTMLNPLTGSANAAWDQPDGSVNSSLPDTFGGFFIGGNFTRVGGKAKTRIAHLDSNGKVTDRLGSLQVNGNVKALAKLGNTLYIGGQFSLLGEFKESTGVVIEKGTNKVQQHFPVFNGEVKTVVPDGTGGWYIGGNFTTVGGVTRNRAARIDSNGNLLAWNPNVNDMVYSLVKYKGNIYIGGRHTQVNGVVRAYLSCVDTLMGTLTGWTANAGGEVRSLCINNDILYVAGGFNSMGGQSRNCMAAFSLLTGTITGFSNTFPVGGVYLECIRSFGAKVYIGGNFLTVGGVSRGNIAALDPVTGNVLTGWQANANNVVKEIIHFNGILYFGGNFSSVRSTTRNRLAVVDTITGALTSLSLLLSGTVYALEIDPADSMLYMLGSIGGGFSAYNLRDSMSVSWNLRADDVANAMNISGSKMFIGGYFTSVGGSMRKNLAAVNASTGEILPWQYDANYPVETFCNVKDSFLYVGGLFDNIGGASRGGLAVFNQYGSLTSTNISFVGDVNTIAYSGDSMVYVGGTFFNAINISPAMPGIIAKKGAAINHKTSRLTAWQPDANNDITVMLVDSNLVYCGGEFSSIGGQSRSGLAAVNRTTALATSFNPPVSAGGAIYSMVRYQNSLIVAGSHWLNSTNALYIANLMAFDINTSLLTGFSCSPSSPANTLSLWKNRLYCGGDFEVIGGKPRSNFAAFHGKTGQIFDLTFPVSNTGNVGVNTIALSDNLLFIGGQFSLAKDSARTNVAAMDLNTGNVTSFKSLPNGTIASIHAQQGLLFISGQFTTIDGLARQRIAVYDIPSFTLNSFNATFSGAASTFLPYPGSRLMMGGGFSSINSVATGCFALYGLPSLIKNTTPQGANNQIYKIMLHGNKLLIGGSFSTFTAQSRKQFAVLDTSTMALTPFSAGVDNTVADLYPTPSNHVYLTGVFGNAGTQVRKNCAAVSLNTGVANWWYPEFANKSPFSVNIRRILPVGNYVILAGDFTSVNGIKATGITAVYGCDTGISLVPSIQGNVCLQQSMSVNFIANGVFNPANNFVLELIDTTRLNDKPVILSTINTTGNGVFNFNFPVNVPLNTPLKFQIRSTSPITISKPSATYIKIMDCIPVMGPTNLSVTNVTGTSTTLKWTRGSGAKCLVVARQGAAVNPLPSQEKTYAGNEQFTIGDTIGTNNYVVYNGSSNTATITGLSPYNTYHFAVVEFNQNAAGAFYQNANVLRNSATTLPVKWLGFNAKLEDANAVRLSWITTAETNNNYFEIQRSADNVSFEYIGKVKGSGTTNLLKEYMYTDNLTEREKQIQQFYYRLKQVDYSGKSDYSKTVSVFVEKQNNIGLTIMPNPAHNQIMVYGSTEEAVIYDLTGVAVMNIETNCLTDISKLKKGLYIIRSGNTAKKFIKE